MSTFEGRFKFARKTAATWTSDNPILLEGEIGIESDTGLTKFGDGSTAWNSLGYAFVALTQDQTIAGVKTFSSSPIVPTPSPGDNTTKAASTAFVVAALTALINSAPGALDTLDELAAALGDDENFAATITALLAAKASLTGAETLTNKRVTSRVATIASSATPTPDIDSYDGLTITALAEGATFGAPSGTPTDFQPFIIRIKDDGTARSLAFNAIYRAVGVELPSTTVLGKTLYLGLLYNSAATKYDVVAVVQEA